MFSDRLYGSSEIVQRRLAGSTVVKTLNHTGYHELEDERVPVSSPERRALGVAGDEPGAVKAVAEVIERIGYDAISLDSLRAGRLFEPGVRRVAAQNRLRAGRVHAGRLEHASSPSQRKRDQP